MRSSFLTNQDSSEMLLAAEDDSELLKDFKRLSILQNIKAFITKVTI